MTAPILLFGIGNESRGDDALAPLLVRELAAWCEAQGLLDEVEVLEDYQLQVEHVTDLGGRQQILFIDADVSCADSYLLTAVVAEQEESYTTHAMHPAALLQAYLNVYGEHAPPSYMLRIRGHEFGLGLPLSRQGRHNLQAAVTQVQRLCSDRDASSWRNCADKQRNKA